MHPRSIRAFSLCLAMPAIVGLTAFGCGGDEGSAATANGGTTTASGAGGGADGGATSGQGGEGAAAASTGGSGTAGQGTAGTGAATGGGSSGGGAGAGGQAPSCAAGTADCDGDADNGCETSTDDDPAHCGSCVVACAFGENGYPVCAGGVCSIGCNDGHADCDGDVDNGCETGTLASANDCGGCGLTCPAAPNAAPTCVLGSCATDCDAGFADCNFDPSDGCEGDLALGTTSCGQCGLSCSFAHAAASCSAGSCQMGACEAGYADCDGDPNDGCEANLEADPSNCGSCAALCPSATGVSVCTAGVCGVSSCVPGFGDCDGDLATGCEINTSSSVAHCGACQNPCSFANGIAVCAGGACQLAACVAPFADCDGNAQNGCETNVQTSPTSCGGCGSGCAAVSGGAASCKQGVCQIACDPGFGNCDGDATNGCEVDLAASPADCGACGTTCPFVANAYPVCSAGACSIGCNTQYADCNGDPNDGCEAFLLAPASCGTCTNACGTANGMAFCAWGTCMLGCDDGYGDCDMQNANGCETPTGADVQNCGYCGRTCSAENGTAACADGMCSIVCDAGFADCDGPNDGCETNLSSDPMNCGGCKKGCFPMNGQPSCQAGSCAVTCDPGFADCDGDAEGGCEVQTGSDPDNCGACGNACALVANGNGFCEAGVCVFQCEWPFENCDGDESNGCETDLSGSNSNCGACGGVCVLPAFCNDGQCSNIACAYPLASCDGNSQNGCETNLATDPLHCGQCATACPPATACVNGSCGGVVCPPGFANCDGGLANGCETNVAADEQNCGQCGVACAPGASCSNGMCGGAACPPGYGDCNGNPADSCEANLMTSPQHCGMCNSPCSPLAVCSGGSCQPEPCPEGLGDCNGSALDGCETELWFDPQNCGTCKSACPNPGMCEMGSCIVMCADPLADCDGSAANGCETDTATSPTSCGYCGHVCPSTNGTAGCANGSCTIACTAGFGNCDGNPSNGCEADLLGDPAHCGACPNACTAGPNTTATCTAGVCTNFTCIAGFADCNADMSDGCEAELATDEQNCGTCGTLCGNAGCNASVCTAQPVELASFGVGSWCLEDIAVGASQVFVTDSCGGKVHGADLVSGTATTVAAGQVSPRDIAHEGGWVFWADSGGNSVRKVAAGGGAVTTLATGEIGASGVAVDATNVYFTDETTQLIRKVAIGGGVGVTIAAAQSSEHVAVDATHAYWVANGQLRRVVKDGSGPPETLDCCSFTTRDIAVDATNVYWTDGMGVLTKLALSGGTTVTVAAGGAWGVATDGVNVYWTEVDTGYVRAEPVGGGTRATLATGQVQPQGIGLDATSVYWFDNAGKVMKAAKLP